MIFFFFSCQVTGGYDWMPSAREGAKQRCRDMLYQQMDNSVAEVEAILTASCFMNCNNQGDCINGKTTSTPLEPFYLKLEDDWEGVGEIYFYPTALCMQFDY